MTEYNIRLNPNCAAAVHTGLKFKAGDKGITFRIAVDELDTTGTTAKIVFLRANGTSVESDISGTDGVYIYKTLGNEFAVPGKTVADVKFYASGNRESTASFVFEVCGDTMNGLGAGTGGYSDRLEQLVSEAEAAGELTEQAKAELEAAESNMKTTEAEMAAVIQNFKNQYGEVGALNPRGNWNSSVSYGIRDVVFYMGYSWICLAPNIGNAPADGSAYWMKNADLDYSNPNLLINPELEIGAVTITDKSGGTTTVASKWHISAYSGITYSAELTDDGLKITAQNGADGAWLNLTQVNTDIVLEDGTYTLSFYCDKPENVRQCGLGSGNQTIVSGSGYGFEINDNIISNTFTISNNTGVNTFIQLLNEACDITIKWVKLELGVIATPPTPPNKEVEKLKCGATDFREKTKTNINTLPTPTEECDYHVVQGDSTFPYAWGHLQIRYGAIKSEFVATFQTTGYLVKKYIAVYRSGAWSGWVDLTNADTVDGKHASDFLSITGGTVTGDIIRTRSGYATQSKYPVPSAISTTGSTSVGATAITHTTESGENHQLAFDENGACLWDATTNKRKIILDTGNMKFHVLPLDGSVPMSGANLLIGTGYGRWHADHNSCTIGALKTPNNTNNIRSLDIFSHNFKENVADAFQFRDTVNGVQTHYIVLHTGNSQKVVTSASAPSDTSAVWIDSANKVSKIYIDGAWTALA